MTNVSTVMTDDQSGAELVNFARQTAQQLVRNNLTRTQIRNIFTEVRKIESTWEAKPNDAMRRLNMLKPKLAYQAERHRQVKHLRDVLTEAIDQVEKAPEGEREVRLQRCMDLVEAIRA